PAVAVTVLWEKGKRPYALTGPRQAWIGAFGGQHSGNEDCIMRYAVADAYPRGSKRYLISAPEAGGLGLCEDTKGTGVNDLDHPRPPATSSRYGDATKNKACKQQFCVNDKACAGNGPFPEGDGP